MEQTADAIREAHIQIYNSVRHISNFSAESSGLIMY